MNNFEKILKDLQQKPFNQESKDYLDYHALRYQILLKMMSELLKDEKKGALRILDVGPSFQTLICQKVFGEAQIDSLGLKDLQFKPYLSGQFFEFDLNDVPFKKKWPKIGPYDLIILAEVLEHLYTAPIQVLEFLSSLLAKGGLLIIQTPNAVSLGKRKTMLLGKNPYEMLRETREGPGHFREYTLTELIKIAKKAGLKPASYLMANYFPRNDLRAKFYNFISFFLPSSFRDGLTIVFRK